MMYQFGQQHGCTKHHEYLSDAKQFPMKDSSELFWDNKYAGAKTLPADLNVEAEHIKEADGFCLNFVHNAPRTDQNMLFIQI